MKNLSAIFKAYDELRDQKKSTSEIREALIKKGFPKNDVAETINKKNKIENERYIHLSEEYTGGGLYINITSIVFYALLACFLTYMIFYFGYYTVKSFQPIELQKGQVIIGDTSWVAELGIYCLLLAILFLFMAIPAIGATIKRIRKLITGRKDWEYLEERIGR